MPFSLAVLLCILPVVRQDFGGAASSLPSVHGVLVDELGAPLSGWAVGAVEKSYDVSRFFGLVPFDAEAVTDADGSFALDPVPGPGFVLVARSPGRDVLAIRESFVLGEDVELRVRPEDRPSAWVEGSLALPPGAAADELRVTSRSADDFEHGDGELVGLRFRLGPLRPGKHRVRAGSDELGERVLDVELRGGQILDVGMLRLKSPGRVRISYDDRRADPERDLYTWVLRDGIAASSRIRHGEGTRFPIGRCGLTPPPPPEGFEVDRSGPLPPGRYLLRTRHRGSYAPDLWVDVAPGETAEVALRVEPATERTVALNVPERDPSTRAHLRVTTADGTLVSEDTVVYRGEEAYHFVFDVVGLTVGTYRLDARSGSGLTASAELEVRDLSADYGRPLVLDAR